MSAVLIGMLVVGFLLCPAMLFRNWLIFEFRTSMLRSIRSAAQEDIATGRDWRWRYAAYDQVSYNEMMLRPWRRLRPESWYADTSFLRGGAR